jgi:pectinesterase inhibitor-like protein
VNNNNISYIPITTKMRPLFSSFYLLFFISTLFHATNSDNLIQETCKKCSQKDPNLSYNFCVTSLQASPELGLCDNLHHLGKISIKLLNQNVTNTRNYIKKLLENKTKLDPYTKACLSDCFELYSDAVPTLSDALKDYKARRYENANIEVSSVFDASTTCEDGFKEKESVISPLTKRNNNTFQLSAIALSIVEMLY